MSQTPDEQPDPARQQGISLHELTEAFAQAMGTGRNVRTPAEATPEAEQPVETEPDATSREPGDMAMASGASPSDAAPARTLEAEALEPGGGGDDACPISPRTILEAMLFVGDRDGLPLKAARAAELMRGVEPEEIPELVGELNRHYAAVGSPLCILNDGSGYRMTLRKAFHSLRDRFYGRIREARLSQTAIDVLAIIAYQQPVTADEIKRARGKPCHHVLRQLIRRGLLRIEREEGKPRLVRYYTTDRFLRLFRLESLDDLPQSQELDRS